MYTICIGCMFRKTFTLFLLPVDLHHNYDGILCIYMADPCGM